MVKRAIALAGVLFFCPIFYSTYSMTQSLQSLPCPEVTAEIVAPYIVRSIRLDAAHPAPEWQKARPVTFCTDWQGNNVEPELETRVRLMWSPDTLYLRFESKYRELYVFDDSDPNGRRDQLWDRDVAEAFLQPDPSRPFYYREFEVSPNGMWVDLDISPGGRTDLNSGLRRSVFLDERTKSWAAELAIPMKSLTSEFDPKAVWRVNFFRVEGRQEPRKYMAWQPTHSPEPNFHVPSAFGRLRFGDGRQ